MTKVHLQICKGYDDLFHKETVAVYFLQPICNETTHVCLKRYDTGQVRFERPAYVQKHTMYASGGNFVKKFQFHVASSGEFVDKRPDTTQCNRWKNFSIETDRWSIPTRCRRFHPENSFQLWVIDKHTQKLYTFL